jgi:glutaredoxin
MMNVKIYSTGWCSFCRAQKAYLDAQGVKYEDINIETDEKSADEMMHLSGQTGVPFTVITGADGQQTSVLGFDQPRLRVALGLAA